MSAPTLASPASGVAAPAVAGPAVRQVPPAPGAGTVLLASPRGFCSGVRRAIRTVEQALAEAGAPVHVRRQIVHNEVVVRSLEERGARFVDSVDDVPEGGVCVFSAHGVSPAVRERAAARSLQVVDATCPLVHRVHARARQAAQDGDVVVLVGHADHEEIEGVRGEAPDRTVVVSTPADVAALHLPPDGRITCLTQTTFLVERTAAVLEALHERYPDRLRPRPDDVCRASRDRQDAVRSLAARCDVVLVVGSENSSNSRRMVQAAQRAGAPAHLVPDARSLDPAWLTGARCVGASSGASAPEALLSQLLDRLGREGFTDVREAVPADREAVPTDREAAPTDQEAAPTHRPVTAHSRRPARGATPCP